jgi:predicted phage-related endonuclease
MRYDPFWIIPVKANRSNVETLGQPSEEAIMDRAAVSQERLNRRHFIGGSDARIVMGADETALLRLWREKRGEIEPEDLSSNLVVQLGS